MFCKELYLVLFTSLVTLFTFNLSDIKLRDYYIERTMN